MSLQKTILLLVLFAPYAAAAPSATVTAPPVMTSVVASPPAPGSCICLRDPATDNLVKNCLYQQRQNENQPRLYCSDAEYRLIEQTNPAEWEILSADHADCTPCDDTQPHEQDDSLPRGD